MAIPNIYCPHYRGTGVPQIYELVNGISLNQIGSDLAGTLETFFNEDSMTNHIIEFKGKRYYWHRTEIKEENEGGAGTWGVAHTVGSPSNEIKSGLYTCLRNGVLNLIGLASAGGGFTAAVRFDGTTWTNISLATGSPIRAGAAIVFNNKLYWAVWNTIYVYDPVVDSIATVSGTGGSFATVCKDFAIVNGNLFVAGYNNSSSSGALQEAKLWMLEDTGFTLKHSFTGLNNDFSGSVHGRPLLFTHDNSGLVFICTGEDGVGGSLGDQAYHIQKPGTGSQVVTDITTSVIPSQFRVGGAEVVAGSRYYLFTDTQNSASPTSPDFYIWRLASSTSGNYGFYTWQGIASELSYQGIGPSYQFQVPDVKGGGQERISAGANATSTNKVYAEMETPVISSTQGAMDVSFRVYGTDTGLDGRVYFSPVDETPSTQATIIAVSGGSTSVASNVISNITADDGATLYTFTWTANTDGVTNGIPVTLVMDLT
jgi:hypothetical protein